MGQVGCFDVANRYAGLDAKKDPLARIDALVPWEQFRPRLEAVWRGRPGERKSPAGRKPWDAGVMFKAVVLCALYNLSDDQVEYQLRDRLSFMRFLGLGLEDAVPDAKTVWLYRERLARAGVIEELFAAFDGHLKERGWLAMGGQIVDAAIVPVPKQRNTREENATIKGGGTPPGWADEPAKRRQKDTDARWTRKHGRRPLRLQEPCQRRPPAQAGAPLAGDGRGGARRPGLGRGPGPGQHGVGRVGGQRLSLGGDRGPAAGEGPEEPHPPQGPPQPAAHGAREQRGNRTRSTVRARVERVFGAQSNDMGGVLVRSIGLVRAKARIGLKNLAYNMRRLVQLERPAAAAA